jgi:HAD superfamily hydrolase (TIGR01549 family)
MSNTRRSNLVKPPKLVLFDLDDTLCDHAASLRIRLRMAFGPAIDELPGIDLDEVVEASAARAIAGTDHFAAVLGEFGVSEPEKIEQVIQRYVGDRYRGLKLYEEALETVHAVRRWARIGLITNGPSQIQRDKLVWLEIGDLFPLVLISEEEGIEKPDPEIFHRALRSAGSTPHEAAFVGNSPEADIAGAQAAGLVSVWLNRRGLPWPAGAAPDYQIRNLQELLPLLGLGASGS